MKQDPGWVPAPLGRFVNLEARPAGPSNFQVGLDSVEAETGRLTHQVEQEFEGSGTQFQAGDVLFGKLRPYLAKAWLADRTGAAVGDFYVLRVDDGQMLPEYLRWLLLSRAVIGPLMGAVTGAKMPRVSWQYMKTVRVRVPSLPEQARIASYLDRETAQIDTLIAEQERFLDLVREKRHGGLDALFGPRVGQGTRLKWLVTERDQRAGDRAQGLPLLSVSIEWGVRRRDETVGKPGRADDVSVYKIAEPGDLVLNRMRAFQGGLGVARERGLVSPDYAVICGASGISADWLGHVMKSRGFVHEMSRRVRGIGSISLGAARTPRINLSDLGDIRLSVASPAEQKAEIASAESLGAGLDVLAAEAELLVRLARERRSALITAAVTGQLDIPEGLTCPPTPNPRGH